MKTELKLKKKTRTGEILDIPLNAIKEATTFSVYLTSGTRAHVADFDNLREAENLQSILAEA